MNISPHDNNHSSFETPPAIIPWLISLAFFMQMIDGSILNTALPEIARDIGENPLQIQSVVVAYMLTIAAILPMTGWLAEKVGAKKVFLYALGVFTVGSIMCAGSYSLATLVLSRVFQGVGGALMAPIGRLIILKLYPKKQLVKIMSLIVLPALLGPILGPPLGGFMVQFLSWHWIFLINIPIGVFAIGLCYIKMPEVPRAEIKKFDWFGFLSLSAAIVLICLSASQSTVLPLIYTHKIVMFIAAVILLGLFWAHVNRSSKPLFSQKLVEVRSFVAGIVGNLFCRLGFSAMPLLIPLLLQVELGISPAKTGTLMLATGVASIVGKFGIEKLLNVLGYRKLLMINTTLIGVIICCFCFIGRSTPEATIFGLLFVLGFVNSIQFTAMNTLTIIDLPKKYESEGNSMQSIVMQVAMALGVSIGASVLNVFEGVYDGDNLLRAFRLTFISMGVFTALSSFSFLLTPKNAGE